jgi:hypothetical protein
MPPGAGEPIKSTASTAAPASNGVAEGALAVRAASEPAPEGSAGSALPESETINAWPDEVAESAMLSELRSKGENVSAPRRPTAPVEETDTAANLPPLDELVGRIPPEVREVLEDLFRAKFVAVRRVPKQALKKP